MAKAFLLYPKFLDDAGSKRTIGGIQTYMVHLAKTLALHDIQPEVIQLSDRSFETHSDGLLVTGIACQNKSNRSQVAEVLWKSACKKADFNQDFIIFCTDNISVKTDYKRAILIQHGISWDIPLNILPAGNLIRKLSTNVPGLDVFRKFYQGYRYKKCFDNVLNKVCVDYNFVNWYKTLSPVGVTGNVKVIPNCVFPADQPVNIENSAVKHKGCVIEIIFARRFEPYRGSRVMIDAAKIILANTADIGITFAGSGEDKSLILDTFSNSDRITVTSYQAEESLSFHANFDIAIVPSLASEGTSLSVLEAMASGCAVCATPIGGVSNIIIDGFNGIFVEPTGESIAAACIDLAYNTQKRSRLQKNAIQVLDESAFSYNEWGQRWMQLINAVR